MPPPIPSAFRPALDGPTPLSLAQLADVAGSAPHAVLVSRDVPLRRYLGGAEQLRRQAAQDAGEGRSERAFVSLVKCAKLLLELLPSHPEYRALDAEGRAKIRQGAQAALDELGQLKPKLAARHEAWRANPGAFAPPRASSAQATGRSTPEGGRRQANPPLARASSSSEAAPARPQGRGFDVRDVLGWGPSGPPSPGASRDVVRRTDHQPTPFPNPRAEPAAALAYPTLRASHSIRMAKHQENQGFAPSSLQSERYFQTMRSASTSALPNPHASEWYNPHAGQPRAEARIAAMPQPQQPLGAYPSISHSHAEGPVQAASRRLGAQDVEREARRLLAEERVLAGPQVYTEGGEALRTVRIPSALISRFVALADPNTQRNIETLGLLMGRLTRDVFTVSHLMVPKQTGTSDRCDTVDEESIWEFQTVRDLICLGWIHTHPFYSSFLSSRDLHTHSGWQSLLPEAVAIVCAPNSDPAVGLFRLTDPPGLKTIINCRVPGEFHPHASASGESLALYTDVTHVVLDGSAPLSVDDLR